MNVRSTVKLFIPMFAAVLLAGCWDKGGGEKIGSITRLQRTGLFCKTWEGEIIRGGLNSGSGVIGYAFHFTVENEALAQQVQKAMEAQQEVKISYNEEAFWFCRSDSNGFFLSKIEPLGSVSVPPTQSKEVTGIAPAKPTAEITARDLLEQNRAILEEMRKQREFAERGAAKK